MRLGFWAIEIGVQRILPSPLWFPRRVTREGESGTWLQSAGCATVLLPRDDFYPVVFSRTYKRVFEVVENAIYNTRLLEAACERTEYRLFISNNLFICLFRKMLASFYANYQNTKNIKFFIKVI